MLIAQTFCNIHFIYVWNCKNRRCYKKLQLLLDQSRLAVLLILFFFGQKKSFLWQIWQKRLLWLKSILCNHNSVITLLSTHEIIHANINVVQSCWNFAQLSKISKNKDLVTQCTSRRFGKYSFFYLFLVRYYILNYKKNSKFFQKFFNFSIFFNSFL